MHATQAIGSNILFILGLCFFSKMARYGDFMAAILAKYCDIVSPGPAISTLLFTLLGHSPEHLLDVVLQVTRQQTEAE